MTSIERIVCNCSSHYIDEVVISQDGSVMAIYSLDEHRNRRHLLIHVGDIIGVGLVNIKDRKCIRIVCSLSIALFAGNEDMCRRMIRSANTYRGRIKCNGGL
jgi:hypothetical protein